MRIVREAGYILTVAAIILLGCGEKESADEVVMEEPQRVIKNEKNISERFLRIDGNSDTLRSYELGKNLFGKFYRERAEFYIIENPNKTIYNRPVKSITLYFLDGMLAKTKYELEDDISDDLIQSYGAFSIKGMDTLTRALFKREKILSTENKRKVLNKNLLNYELKWEFEAKYVYTRVDKSSPKKRFEYIESLKDYASKFRRLEQLN
jgi:hypothetical protein